MVQNALIVIAAFLVLAGLAGIGAGAPSSFAGLGLGSTLLESGTVALVGGLILFGLVMVLNSLRDLEDRIASLNLHAAPPESARPRRALPAPVHGRFEPASGSGDAMEMPDQRFDRRPPVLAGEEQVDPLAPRPRRSVEPSESRMEESLRERRARRERERENGRDMSPARSRSERPLEPAPAPRGRREKMGGKPAEPARRSRRDSSFSLTADDEAHGRETAGSVSFGEERRGSADRAEMPAPAETKDEPHLVTERNPTGAEILRSGIIGSMAYTLYSDGSIEAELPIGTVRFASIEDLQHHVKRTGEEINGEFTATKQ